MRGLGGVCRVYGGHMKVAVDIPDFVADQMLGGCPDPGRKLLEDAVAQAYREGKLTEWEVQQALGMETRFEVDPFLGRYEICDYTIEDFRKDLQAADRARAKGREEAA